MINNVKYKTSHSHVELMKCNATYLCQSCPWVGSGRVESGRDFAGYWRVGSGRVGSALRISKFLLIISWYLN